MQTDDRNKTDAPRPLGVERHIAQQPAQGQTIPPDIDESHRPERRQGERRQADSDRRGRDAPRS